MSKSIAKHFGNYCTPMKTIYTVSRELMLTCKNLIKVTVPLVYSKLINKSLAYFYLLFNTPSCRNELVVHCHFQTCKISSAINN